MKKLILSLFIFCSVFAFPDGTIPIPQVIGLPAALAGKQPLLPTTPTNPESKFLNGNKQWAEIISGSGGYASNVYFTNLTSTIVGSYKQTSRTADAAETIASATCNNNEVLIYTYLFEQPVGVTTVDAGVWRITLNSVIDAAAGDSKFKFVQFKRSALGVETDMFTVYSNTIENRVGYEGYLNNIFETVQPSFSTNVTDYLGCRIYATTTASGNRTLSYKVGDGFASYLSTPLAPRHDDLRDKNGNLLYQHPTSAQIATWTTTSLNNTVDETLTSIKTKLGAASSSNSGYLVNTDWTKFNTSYTSRIQSVESPLYFTSGTLGSEYASSNSNGCVSSTDWNMFNTKQPQLNGTGFIKASGTAISYDNSTYEPSFSKNTGFNKNFGTTTGTVLEGRTFGTAAGSAVGDFVAISPVSTQTGSINISGGIIADQFKSTNNYWGGVFIGSTGSYADFAILAPDLQAVMSVPTGTKQASFSSTINSTGFLLNGNNLFSSLSTNYIPKWNGSNFVNSTAGTDYQLPITITTNGTTGVATKDGNNINIPNYSGSGSTSGSYTTTVTNITGTSSIATSNGTYTHVGAVCTVSLRVSFTFTGVTDCEVSIPLPFTNVGTGSAYTVVGNLAGNLGTVYAGSTTPDTAHANVSFKKPSTTSSAFFDVVITYITL